MDAILDKFGRVVIPKKIREPLGIGPGSVFHIEAENREIHLKPVEENTGLKKIKTDGWCLPATSPRLPKTRWIRSAGSACVIFSVRIFSDQEDKVIVP